MLLAYICLRQLIGGNMYSPPANIVQFVLVYDPLPKLRPYSLRDRAEATNPADGSWAARERCRHEKVFCLF